MPRKLRVALFALVVLVVAVAAGTARAVPRMPIGFYDDPSFRWAPKPTVNLASAEKTHASIIHVLADWSQIAPTKPKSAAERERPGLPALRPRRPAVVGGEVRPAGAGDDLGHTALGERQPDAEPPAEEPERPDAVRAHARRALQRHPSRLRRRDPVLGLERAEPRAVPDPAVQRHEGRQPGDVREALHGRLQRDQGGQQAGAGRGRRDLEPWPQRPDPGLRLARAGDLRPARLGREPQAPVRRLGDAPISQRLRARPGAEGRVPERLVVDDEQVRRLARAVVPPPGADLGDRVRRADQAGVSDRRRQLRAAGCAREAGVAGGRSRSGGRDVHLVHLPRQHLQDVVQRPREEGPAPRSRPTPRSPSRRRRSSARRSSCSPARRSRSPWPCRT